MRYCIHCGKEIKETADFCPHCGKQQAKTPAKPDREKKAEVSPNSNEEGETTKEGKPESEEAGKKYRQKIVPAVVVCLVVIAGIFIGRAIISGIGGSRTSDEKALKEIIADQRAMGATINEKNGARYEWNEDGRLVGISWNGCSLNGSISFSELTCLERLDCGNNQLSGLDVSGCSKLKELYCSGNQLGKLDVNDCTELESLQCSGNSLGELAVGNCTSLKRLRCSNNNLEELDVSPCKDLEELYCDEDLKISGCSVGIIQYE